MKKIFIILLSAISLAAYTQQQKTVAVLDPICRDNSVNAFFQQMVRGAMESAVTASAEYEAYDRSAFDMIQKEQAFQRTGAVSDSQIKKMGEMAGVDYVLVSEVSAYEGYLSAIVKILNVTTGKYDKSIDDFMQLTPESVKNKCKEMASSLFGILPSKNPTQPNLFSPIEQNKDYTETAYGTNMKMIWVEGGDFLMGCTSEQGECEDEVRRININGFYIGMLEVTQSQWEKVMGTNLNQQGKKYNADYPIVGIGVDYPMYYVSWNEAMEFCRILSNKTGKRYSLPTEAQWEYAARGGKNPEETRYAGSNVIDMVAWYSDNNDWTNHPCGSKRPNSLGIYDMSGNVWEWCKDWYDWYNKEDTDNPTGPSTGESRVIRGGGLSSEKDYCRVSFRNAFDPDTRIPECGFRVVCIP